MADNSGGGAGSPPPGTMPPGTNGGGGGNPPPGTPDPTQTSVYKAAADAAQSAYNNAVSALQQQEALAYSQLGYNADGSLNGDPYGQYQQLMRADDMSQQQLDLGLSRTQQDNARSLSRENQAFQNILDNLGTQRGRLQQNSGLRATFDSLMNPTGLHIDTSNDHSQYANMLGSEAQAFEAARQSAMARGMGDGKGLAGKALAQAEFGAAGQRQDFKQQLLNQLTDLATSQKQSTQQHSNALSDLALALSRYKQDYGRNVGDLAYKRGADQANVAKAFEAAQSAYNQGILGAKSGLSNALAQALYDSIMYLAANDKGNTTIINNNGGGGGGGGGNPPVPPGPTASTSNIIAALAAAAQSGGYQSRGGF